MNLLNSLKLNLGFFFFCLLTIILIPTLLTAQETRLTKYTYSKENSFWLDMIDHLPLLTARKGIIRNYDSRMDSEYWIDFNSYNFSILDDSRYVESDNAFRAMAGSINSSRFFTEGGFKIAHTIEGDVYFKVNYTREENYQSDHDVILVELGKKNIFNSKFSFYGNISVETDKEDMDLVIGSTYQPIENLNIDLQLVAIDFLNNLLNEGGGISEHQQPEKRIFDRQPYAFRLRTSYEWNDYRIELYGAADTPENAEVTFESNQFDDFREEIRYAYFGGKLEKQWKSNFTTGIYGSVRSGKHYRIGEDENDFRLDELHSEIGIYGLYQINEKWRIESDWAYSSMATEKYAATEEPALDTDDWAFYGKSTVFWQFKPRWQLQSGIAFDRRVMETLVEKYPLDDFNLRLIMGIRYQLRSNFLMMLTNNIGLENFYSYDGSSLSIQLTW